MAGVIGNGLLGSTYTGDLDNLIDAGVYQVVSTTTGKPTILTDGIVVMLATNNTPSIGVQLALGAGGKMFYRYKWFNSWSVWFVITSTTE